MDGAHSEPENRLMYVAGTANGKKLSPVSPQFPVPPNPGALDLEVY